MNMADELELILPDERHEAAALEYRRGHFAHGERELHGSALEYESEPGLGTTVRVYLKGGGQE